MAQNFRLNLSLKKQPGDEVVRFKVDGGRFESARTLKLYVNTTYHIELAFRPAVKLARLNVQGGNVTLTEEKRDSSGVTYKAPWLSSGVDACKKGSRIKVPILMELADMGDLKLELQCKFYTEAEKSHANWGDMVHFIEYECSRPANSTYIDIKKETFR